MQTEVWVPLAVAAMAAGAGVVGASVQGRNGRKASSEQAVRETLDEVYEQRITFRDEQIVALKSQVTDLIAEVRRLTTIIEELGGEA